MILNDETFKRFGYYYQDAKPTSKIVCKCDFCGYIFDNRIKFAIEKSHTSTHVDCCSKKECIQKKRLETFRKKFGCDYPSQNKEVQKKNKRNQS